MGSILSVKLDWVFNDVVIAIGFIAHLVYVVKGVLVVW
jgi:hypothetical protein